MPESQVSVMLVAVLSVTTGVPGALGRAEKEKKERDILHPALKKRENQLLSEKRVEILNIKINSLSKKYAIN